MPARQKAKKRERIIATSVDEIPGKQLACRQHHPWPSERLEDSKKLPVGLRAVLVDPATNMWWLVDECPRCGKIRYKRYPNRRYDGKGWHYLDPRDGSWVIFQEKFSSADAFNANVARNFVKLFGENGDTPS